MKKIRWFIVVGLLSTIPWRPVAADPLVWQTPLGQFGLPFTATEIIAGYDIKYNQGVVGASLPIWSLPNDLAALQVGAVGAWATQAANAQPYVGFGHDFARNIPLLAQYKSAHLNAFGRWATDRGDKIPIGYGVSLSYSPGTAPAPELPSPLLPAASLLNVIPRG